jgi:hypothetical protein
MCLHACEFRIPAGPPLDSRAKRSWTKVLISAAVFGVSIAGAFLAINVLTGSPLLIQFRQAWASHFSTGKSFEYGSATDRPFDWLVPLKNFDTTLPALIGTFLMTRLVLRKSKTPTFQRSSTPFLLLPLAWLALTFTVFPLHTPWWAYYYVHNAIPLSWCAGAAIAEGSRWAFASGHDTLTALKSGARECGRRSSKWMRFLAGAFCCVVLAVWIGARLYLEVIGIRAIQRIETCLVLKEIERFRPYTEFIFSQDAIYSFHSGIPVPPHLAMLSLKRFWSGDMTRARLRSELEQAKPGLILLPNSTDEVPFQDLVNREYRMVYFDPQFRLFAHKSISKKGAL